MIDETMLEAEEKMEKAVEVAKEHLAGIRTGRVNPGLFSGVMVDYYGSPTPLQQLASFQTPEARTILVTPFDASDRVEPKKLRPIIDRAIEAGVHILVANGNTGEFYGLTDRGPNVDGPNKDEKVAATPDFTPQIGRFKLEDGAAVLQSVITLKGRDGRPLNGRNDTAAG